MGQNYSKLNRPMNEFEKRIDERLRSNQSIIEAVLKKSQSRVEASLLAEEERYKMKKRQVSAREATLILGGWLEYMCW